MVEKFLVRVAAERLIHNDLDSCAGAFRDVMHKKINAEDTEGVYFDKMGSLVFFAFEIEAKVNFVGWKVLKGGWPERANFREKVDLLIKVLSLNLLWENRPLQTISKLNKFRNTIAHGKPEIVNKTEIADVEPEVWDALKGQWEDSVTSDNVDRCCEDVEALWKILLDAADIPVADTLTRGGHSLTRITG